MTEQIQRAVAGQSTEDGTGAAGAYLRGLATAGLASVALACFSWVAELSHIIVRTSLRIGRTAGNAVISRRVACVRGRGNFLRQSAPRDGIAAMLAVFNVPRQAGQMGNLEFLTFGGAVNRIPADATAFVHRDAENDVAITWVNSCWDTMQRYSSPHSYQNFADPALANWWHSYYGSN